MSTGRDREQETRLPEEPGYRLPEERGHRLPEEEAGLAAPSTTETAPRASRKAQRREAREARRSMFEDMLVRLVATCGVVAIGVAIAAIMTSNNSAGWIVGLVVSVVSVVLAGILWSSRRL